MKITKEKEFNSIKIGNKIFLIGKKFNFEKLKNITDVKDGTHDSPVYTNNGIPFITSKNLLGNNKIDFENVKYISQEDHNKFYKRSDVKKGDLLFGMIGTIGNPVVVTDDIIFSIKNVALIKKNINIDTNLIRYQLLNNEILKHQFKMLSQGGVLQFIKLSDIRNLYFLNCNSDYQNKIAKLLSEKEQHIENIKTLISKLEKRNEYYAEKLLSGELRVKENEKGEIEFYENTEWKEVETKIFKNGKIKCPIDWNVFALRKLFISSIGGEYGEQLNENNKNLETDVITLHIFANKNSDKAIIKRAVSINKLKQRIINNGDIIIEKSGGTDTCSVGRVHLAENIEKPTTSVNFTNILKIDCSACVSKYVFELLNFFHKKRVASKYEQKTVGIANLKQNDYFNLQYIFPEKKEQESISKAFFTLQKEKQILENLLEKENKEFEWLSEKLLSGEYIIED